MKTIPQFRHALLAIVLTWIAPLQAADITFIGHQDGIETDADTPTITYRF